MNMPNKKKEVEPIQVLVLIRNNSLKTMTIKGLGNDVTSCLVRLLTNAHINIMEEICKGEDIVWDNVPKTDEGNETDITITRGNSENSETILNCLLSGLIDLQETNGRKIDIQPERINEYYMGMPI